MRNVAYCAKEILKESNSYFSALKKLIYMINLLRKIIAPCNTWFGDNLKMKLSDLLKNSRTKIKCQIGDTFSWSKSWLDLHSIHLIPQIIHLINYQGVDFRKDQQIEYLKGTA
ncbi:MAG: hypothetical protein Ta2E_10620 [Mycoplasmoidaceae bacterium]|nr:MAG: hypothetical protein Ta2E_10620 [Mycoplasmoidaceae bacterium]